MESGKKTSPVVAFGERETNVMTSTPVGGKQRNTTQRKSTGSGSPMCLGDFIMGPMKTKQRKSLGNEPSPTTLETKINENRSHSKPKKRVAPITLSKSVSMIPTDANNAFATSDSFIKNAETPQTPERALLKTHKEAITNDFLQQTQDQHVRSLHAAFKDKIIESSQPPPLEIDLTKVTHKQIITRLSDIFVILLDCNLAINILTEISYLVNLINTETDPFSRETTPDEAPTSVLKNLNNCIFFALTTLARLKHLLVMLDAKTINVLMKNERISANDAELTKFLKDIFQYKSNLASKLTDSNNLPGYSYVFYQQENDSKGNFPTEREFGAFKKQRDMFYAILKSWEQKHFNPSFNFSSEYGSKVKALLGIIDHPINMAHLAKLFTAQLIISCNFDQSASELQLALPSIDLTKLSKLRQRLVAPSQFSTQFLFPGNQAFFQDFIIASDNNSMFLEQLKLALIAELMEMNDASYCTHVDIECSIDTLLDVSNRSAIMARANSETDQIIQPSTIITMRVLAKFIGFVTSRPYMYDVSNRNFVVDERQIQLRNMILPTFDIKSIILRSATEKKLVVTIPWIVQYLYMLDYVSLCLDYYKGVFRLLYKLYISYASESLAEKFVIRACLGWLFEHCSLSDDYFSFHAEIQSQLETLDTSKSLILHEKDLAERCLSPHLEHIIVAACPFLADLRVSIMPSRFEKQVSRTGRFRHITTTQTTTGNGKLQAAQDGQTKLTEAFLQSQSLSVRRIVEFIVERVTSAVVKDFQYKHMIPVKNEAVEGLKLIKSNDAKVVAKEMTELYLKSFALLIKLWDETVFVAVERRTKAAFDALLPLETIENVKKTCIHLATDKIIRKVNDWRVSHMRGTEIFSKTIRADADRLVKANITEHQTNFQINIHHELPSEFFNACQEIQHKASLHPQKVTKELLMKFLKMFHDILVHQQFTTNLYRTCGSILLVLVQTLIVTKPELITDDDVLEASNQIWKSEKMIGFIKKSRQDESPEREEGTPTKKQNKNLFAHLISARFILQLDEATTKDATIKCLLKWLKSLIESQLVTISELSEMFVSLFQYEWEREHLETIRFLSKSLSEFKSVGYLEEDDDDGKSNLFLDLVADFAVDLEC